jgi:6-phosphogluconolactonase (cycloisomerase 2 family)
MAKRTAPRYAMGTFALWGLLLGMAGWLLVSGLPQSPDMGRAAQAAQRAATGAPQLVAVDKLPEMEGVMCELQPASAAETLMASLQQAAKAATADQSGSNIPGDRAPLRIIRDTNPTYSAIAVDTNSNEVFLEDENLFGIRVFDRTTNTPPSAKFSEPKRTIGGLNTKLEFNCGLYVDPKTGDIYSVANDTVDTLVIFPRDAQGNVKPMREIHTPHGTFGIAVDEANRELFLTVQHEHAVVVYQKEASGDDKPLRRLDGTQTHLQDPHGIALDLKDSLMFVSNHGSVNDRQKVGTGRFNPPSITVYPIKAEGNTPPLRVIQGPKTMLNWPAAMAWDPEKQELYVANDAGNGVLVFGADANGDAAPLRAIQGPKTGIRYPTGLYLDLKNRELWLANMGNHAATAYKMDANGNVAPVRTIRSTAADQVALAIGNPGAVAYDSKREEILVPN